MRKLLLPLLLASALAAPAVAAPDDDTNPQTQAERQQARSERQQAREQERSERVERATELRVRSNDGPSQAQTSERPAHDGATLRAARQEARDTLRSERVEQQQLREDRREAIRDSRQLRQSERPLPHVLRNRVPVVSNEPQEGTQPPLRTEKRRYAQPTWSTYWRKDRKYDWWNWRKRNRWLFNLGFYSDPFGWGYRPYSIGWRLWPSYYSSRYWLHDPWMYRLPYAPPGYRWIRYYDDAILIDTWDGRVVDVIYNFFW